MSHTSARAVIPRARLLLGLLLAAAAGAPLLGTAAVTPPGTARPAPLSLAAAVRVLQSGDLATARHMLETLTRQPDVDARTWRTLGSAYQQQHEQRLAIGAYQEALKLEPDSPQVFYALGSAYAAEHDPARALQWLQRARATHRYDMTQINVDPNLQSAEG